MTTVTLTRADTVIALRNAWEDAREYAKTFRRPCNAYRFGLLLRAAFIQIRREKARVAHKAAEAAREQAMMAELAARRTAPAYVPPVVIWEGPQHFLDAREMAELEVLRWEMADSFTYEGNLRLPVAKAALRAIEAQLTRRTVA